MEIIERLNAIQTKLIAGKNQTNNFGNYKYRTAEGILESVKPLLNGCAVVLDDELVNIGDATYIKATATLYSPNGEQISAEAYAQLDTHKGMSAEQATGTASSYARKYALCGLFAVDSNTDVDSLDNTEKGQKTVCTDCGKEIRNGKRTDGSVWKAEEIAIYTERKFGEPLCYECAMKRSKA